ncbi:MAG: hypothetical protein K940chlam2_00208 [Chlamydiae bacterium]|nr:hypothetical protein [Chlamydiota bacterium]
MRLLISEKAILERIQSAAKEIDARYSERTLTLIVVLKGALFVAVDLIRALNIRVELEFVRAQSYGFLGTQAGPLTIDGIEALDVAATQRFGGNHGYKEAYRALRGVYLMEEE